MSVLKTNVLLPLRAISAAVLVALPLAGCVMDDLEADDRPTAYRLEDRYPIKVSGGRAHTKPCGNWTKDATETASNEMFPNHGCAVQANIAAMVADPNDLVRPDTMSMAPGASRAAAVRKINEGQNTNSTTRSIFSIF